MTYANYLISRRLEYDNENRKVRLASIAARLGRYHITNQDIELAKFENEQTDIEIYNKYVYEEKL